jgi:hypothetical protein
MNSVGIRQPEEDVAGNATLTFIAHSLSWIYCMRGNIGEKSEMAPELGSRGHRQENASGSAFQKNQNA